MCKSGNYQKQIAVNFQSKGMFKVLRGKFHHVAVILGYKDQDLIQMNVETVVSVITSASNLIKKV